MPSGAFQTQATNWLAEDGPAELNFFSARFVYHPLRPSWSETTTVTSTTPVPKRVRCWGFRGTGPLGVVRMISSNRFQTTEFPDGRWPFRNETNRRALSGSWVWMEARVRVVAATNRNLKQMMAYQLFRSDLYHQLRVFPITTPLLRDHPEDIPLLARHFTKKYALKMNKQIERIPSDIMRTLVSWTWPGNAGELENFIERAVVLSRGPNFSAAMGELRADPVELPGSGPGQGLAYA